MKIVLISYSQDVNIIDPNESENYIVVGEEESKELVRIPVPFETVRAIGEFVAQIGPGAKEPATDVPDTSDEEEEVEEDGPMAEEMAPEGTVPYVAPPVVAKKTLKRPTATSRVAPISTGTVSGDDGVPSL